MKRKGFTLIELVVVIALIAILAVTLAPRLRDQIAKAGDAKAIAILGSMRTQSEIYFADFQKTIVEGETNEAGALLELEANLDNSAQKLFGEVTAPSRVPVGGTSTTSGSGDVLYGGDIGFTFGKDGVTTASSDGISLWFIKDAVPSGSGTAAAYDTKGVLWASY